MSYVVKLFLACFVCGWYLGDCTYILKDLHYGLAGFIESAVIELVIDLPRSINTVTMHFHLGKWPSVA